MEPVADLLFVRRMLAHSEKRSSMIRQHFVASPFLWLVHFSALLSFALSPATAAPPDLPQAQFSVSQPTSASSSEDARCRLPVSQTRCVAAMLIHGS